ncbi:MAG: hypothetical protein ABGX83_05480 [Nitrospira sp.]
MPNIKILKPGRDFKSIWEPCLLCKEPNYFPWRGQRKLCTECRAYVVERKLKGETAASIRADFEAFSPYFAKIANVGKVLDKMEVPQDGRKIA